MKIEDISIDDTTTYVGVLSEQQKNELLSQQYKTDSYFNPIKDNDDNWIISIEEMVLCDNYDYIWVKNLDLISFTPKMVIRTEQQNRNLV
jgi:hypothetical protein